jgi:hypothetical protein
MYQSLFVEASACEASRELELFSDDGETVGTECSKEGRTALLACGLMGVVVEPLLSKED